ncbi:hypothetical protein ACFQ14_12750 [Pseudahrensia aquimaris]|uniref:Apea-like HEPN domain-containing protein n=1 Tax=Pseudahrensia aquimaris TaxID=744461 RepID=A0ABW3FJ75_9HYPH
MSFAANICDTQTIDFVDGGKPLQKRWFLQQSTTESRNMDYVVMDEAWILEELQMFNSAQKGQKKSRLEHLIEIAAFPPTILANAVEEQERRDAPHVVAFFQIPKPIFAGSGLFSAPAKEHNQSVDLQFTPIELSFDIAGRPKCEIDIGQLSFRPNATQICAFVPIWQKRADYYPRYERCFSSFGMTNNVVIHGHESWIEGRPLTAVDFEHNLSSRIIRELQFSTRRFLKSYSTVAREDALTDDWLYSYFTMPYPWRLSYGSPPTPTYRYYVDAHKRDVVPPYNQKNIDGGINFSFRKFSRFEKQIFSLSQMSLEGNYGLVAVTGLSLIEWILKMNATGKNKKLNLYGLIELFDGDVMSGDIKKYLHDLRKLRNIIIHMNEYSSFKGNSAHEIEHLSLDEQIGKDDATQIIDIAWNLFRASNAGLLQR